MLSIYPYFPLLSPFMLSISNVISFLFLASLSSTFVSLCVCVSMNIVVALYRKVTIFYRTVGTLLKIIPLRKMFLLHEEALRINWHLAIEDQDEHIKSML